MLCAQLGGEVPLGADDVLEAALEEGGGTGALEGAVRAVVELPAVVAVGSGADGDVEGVHARNLYRPRIEVFSNGFVSAGQRFMAFERLRVRRWSVSSLRNNARDFT